MNNLIMFIDTDGRREAPYGKNFNNLIKQFHNENSGGVTISTSSSGNGYLIKTSIGNETRNSNYKDLKKPQD